MIDVFVRIYNFYCLKKRKCAKYYYAFRKIFIKNNYYVNLPIKNKIQTNKKKHVFRKRPEPIIERINESPIRKMSTYIKNGSDVVVR